jgi:hypothetical protein
VKHVKMNIFAWKIHILYFKYFECGGVIMGYHIGYVLIFLSIN